MNMNESDIYMVCHQDFKNTITNNNVLLCSKIVLPIFSVVDAIFEESYF